MSYKVFFDSFELFMHIFPLIYQVHEEFTSKKKTTSFLV